MDNKLIIGIAVIALLSAAAGYSFSQTASLQDKINQLTITNTGLQTQVTQLQSQIAPKQAEIDRLQTQLANKIAEVDLITKEKSALQTQISTLASSTVAKDTEIESLKAQLVPITILETQKNAEIASLQTQLSTAKSQLSALQNQAVSSWNGKVIKIGYICATTTGLETAKPYRQEIIQRDMNDYCKKLGFDVAIQWVIDDAQGQAATHLAKVQALRAMGITVFEGGGWSSMAAAALNYCNTNKMLMWSSASTSPTLAIANDYLFRLCPADTALAPALAKTVWSFGCTKVCFMQRGDSWGDGIKNIFEVEYKKLGGSFTGDIIRYAGESTEFSSYLWMADKQISAARLSTSSGKIGGILLAFDEAVTILVQAKDYPNVYSTVWFGADGTAKNSRITEDVPSEGAAMKCLSLLSSVEVTSKYTDLETRYVSLTKQAYSSVTAYQYDIGFIILQAMLERQSQTGSDIYALMAPVSSRTFGASGWCSLNSYGDRETAFFDIWGYGKDAKGRGIFVNYGSFNTATNIVTWSSDAEALRP